MPFLFKMFGVLGLIIITGSVLIRTETKRDWVHLLGTVFLLLYSIFLRDVIFILVQAFFIVVVLYKINRLNPATKARLS